MDGVLLANNGPRGQSPVSSEDSDEFWENPPDYVLNPPVEAVVYGWGVNEDHQLGIDGVADVLVPKVVDTLLGVRLQGRHWGRDPIVSGSRNSMAIDAQGQLLSWGWNARGTIGHGHTSLVSKPQKVKFASDVEPGVRIRQAAVGGWHCLAVDDAGQMYAWGGNEYGQCGFKTEKRDVVKACRTMIGHRVRMVAAAGMHSLALTDEGEIWIWGEPWGDFSLGASREPHRVDLDARDRVKKICCGAFHNVALTEDGRVLTWGTNDFGQLGLGATCAHTRNNKPTQVVGLEDHRVVDVHAGGWHNALITSEGLCFTWGRGEYGRLGFGDRSGKSVMQPTLVEGLLGHFVVQVACGGSHTMALTQEGRVFAWGRGSFGRLGVPGQREAYSPVEVHLSGGSSQWRVIHISAGGRHSLVYALPLRGESPYASYRPTPRHSATATPRFSLTPQSSRRSHPAAPPQPVLPPRSTPHPLVPDEDADASDATNNTEWENPGEEDAGAPTSGPSPVDEVIDPPASFSSLAHVHSHAAHAAQGRAPAEDVVEQAGAPHRPHDLPGMPGFHPPLPNAQPAPRRGASMRSPAEMAAMRARSGRESAAEGRASDGVSPAARSVSASGGASPALSHSAATPASGGRLSARETDGGRGLRSASSRHVQRQASKVSAMEVDSGGDESDGDKGNEEF